MRNLTPAHLRCDWGGCPAVFGLEDGSIAIIGRKGPRDPMSGRSYFGHPIGDDEELVIIEKALLSTIRDDALSAAQAEIARLANALENLLTNHARLVESGDCGNWDVDQEPEVIEARAALDSLSGQTGESA